MYLTAMCEQECEVEGARQSGGFNERFIGS